MASRFFNISLKGLDDASITMTWTGRQCTGLPIERLKYRTTSSCLSPDHVVPSNPSLHSFTLVPVLS